MNDASRQQGWIICGAAALLALLFVRGVLTGSYMALAIPVAIVTLFALGLAGWVGYTIATIQVEAEPDPVATPQSTDSAPAGAPSATAESSSSPATGSQG